MSTTIQVHDEHHSLHPASDAFIMRLMRLGRSTTPSAEPGSRHQFDEQVNRVPATQLIRLADTPDQVLYFLFSDTANRDRLEAWALTSGWPAPVPQPWDDFARALAQRAGDIPF